MQIQRLDPSADLASWAEAIMGASWDEGSELDEPYTAASLACYLTDPARVFLVAHAGSEVLGIASGAIQRKPYGDSVWLYVDEVDVAVPRRRQGVGRAMMERLLELAREQGCAEVWLATEHDNTAAIALYRSAGAEEERVLGFTLEL